MHYSFFAVLLHQCMGAKKRERYHRKEEQESFGLCFFFFWLCDQGTTSSSYCTPYYCTRTVHVRQHGSCGVCDVRKKGVDRDRRLGIDCKTPTSSNFFHLL
jgi:hypothetical protein